MRRPEPRRRAAAIAAVAAALLAAPAVAAAAPTLLWVSNDSPGLTPEAIGYGVITAEPDGSGQRRLTTGCGDLSDASWSPDGASIVFANGPAASPCRGSEIYAMNADGTGQHAVTAGGADAEFPDYSPDGARVVYDQGANRFSRPHQIWVTNADGTGATQLTHDGFHDDQPHFSPDGRTIMFSQSTGSQDARFQRHVPVNLMLMDDDGSDARPLTVGGGFLSGADFSPDGRSVVFSNDGRIYTMGIDGSALTARTPGPSTSEYYDVEPSWTPDGRSLIFQRVHRAPGCDECDYAVGRVDLPSGAVSLQTGAVTRQAVRPSLWTPAAPAASVGADHEAPVTIVSGTASLDRAAVASAGGSTGVSGAATRTVSGKADKVSFLTVDRSGVGSVAVAIHTPAKRGRCRQFDGRKLAGTGSCAKPHYTTVPTLAKLRKTLGALPAGSYVLEVTARDRRGNRTKRPGLVKLRLR
ncbi:MAG: TolB protein [Thermoleophilaceae bacterium]|nr:TolB protein [Thermoleophilaceae bacterium]